MPLVLRGGRIAGRATLPTLSLSTPENSPPTAPTNLTTSNITTTSVNLSWTASSDVGGSGLLGYVIYRDVSGVDNEIGFSAGTTFNVVGLTAGTAYTFRVRAIDNAGNQSLPVSASVSTSATPDTTRPSPPASVAASNIAATSLTLTWPAAADNVGGSGIARYHVYNGTSLLASVTAPTVTYNVTGLTASTSYTFNVYSEDNAGNVSLTAASVTQSTTAVTDTTAPTVPGTIVSSDITTSGFTITWGASTDEVGGSGLKEYEVYSTTLAIYQKVTAPAVTYTASGLTADTDYHMRVKAIDNAGNASLPASLTVHTLAAADITAPGPPTNLLTSNLTQTGFTLSWTIPADTDVVGYKVFERTLAGDIDYGTTTDNSMAITGLTAGSFHAMRVQAYDAVPNYSTAGQLDVTTADAVAPGSGPPQAPQRMINHPIGLAAGVRAEAAEITAVAQGFNGNLGHVRIDSAMSALESQPRNASFTLQVNAATGGTYKLNVEVNAGAYQETAAIAYDASNATIEARIEALSNVPTGAVTVTGTATKTITFAGDLAGDIVWIELSNNSLTPATATVNVALVPMSVSGTKALLRANAIRAESGKVMCLTAYSVLHARDVIKFNGTSLAGNRVRLNHITEGYYNPGAANSGLPFNTRPFTLTISGPGITQPANGSRQCTSRSGDELIIDGGVTAGQTGEYTLGGRSGGHADNQSVPKNPIKFGGYVGRLAASDIKPDIIEEDNEINHNQARRIGPDPVADHHRLCHAFLWLMRVNPNARLVTAGIANIQQYVPAVGTPGQPGYVKQNGYPGMVNIWNYLNAFWDYCESDAGKAYWATLRAKLPAGVPSSDTYPFHGVSYHAHYGHRFGTRSAGASNMSYPSDKLYVEANPAESNPLTYAPRLQLEMIRRDPDWLGRLPFYLTENGTKHHADSKTGLGIRCALVPGCTVNQGSAVVQGNFAEAGLVALLKASTGLAGVPASEVFPSNTRVSDATSTTLTLTNPANTGRTNATILVLALPDGPDGGEGSKIHLYPEICSSPEGFIHRSRAYRIIGGQLPWPYTATSPKWSPSSVWRYTITATSGNYKWIVVVNGGTGQTTAAIAHNATNAQIQTAIENLSNVPAGCVVVTGGGTTKTVTFTAPAGTAPGLNDSDVTITLTASTLTGGGITGPTDVGIRPTGFPRGQPPIAAYSDFCVKAPNVSDTVVEDGFYGYFGLFGEKKDKAGTDRDFNTDPGDPAGNSPWDALGSAP